MVKTLLKSVVIILVLAGVFFFALRIWEDKKGKSVAPVEMKTPEAAAVVLNHVEVTPAGEGATLTVSDVPAASYVLTGDPSGKSFVIELPGTKLDLLKTSIPSPHPMVSMVDVSQSFNQGASSARIRVELSSESTFKDRLMGKTLYVDIAAKVAATPEPSPEPTMAPRKSVSHRKSKSVEKRTAKKNKSSKSKRSTAKAPPPERMEDLVPPMTGPSDFPPPPSAEIADVPPPPPPANEPVVTGDGSLDLDKLFAESQGEDANNLPPPPAAGAEEPPMENSPNVAAVPPADMGKFDSSKVRKDLPKVQNLSVRDEGGTTVVEIEKGSKTRFKILKMVNPYRVVVELLDVENGFQSEYPAVAGTKVRRIVTKQYSGAEILTRVMIEVDGKPEFQKEIKGNSLIVRIP